MRGQLTPAAAAAGTTALGLMVTAVLVVGCDHVFPITETDGLLDNLPRLVLTGAVGLAATLLATVIVARRPVRSWRPLRRAAVLVGLAVVGLCAAVGSVGRWRHDRAARLIVGTWVVSTSRGPLCENTYYPDGTYEAHWPTDPEGERDRRRSGYDISPDGLRIGTTNLPKQPRPPPDDALVYDRHLTTNGPDEFRVWANSFTTRGGYTYMRVR